MSFNPQQISPLLKQFSSANSFWIAYSGGCDSHVLLHVMASLRHVYNAELKAIHVNHGLSAFANEWEEHCRQECHNLEISYHSIKVNAQQAGVSPEDAARRARYSEWENLLEPGDVLFLAHHQDDQAETVLLQMLRGAGVKGMAAMPVIQSFSCGMLCRPLLEVSREELTAYASLSGLNWIDDPSNFDTDFDRNFLRHDAIPLLETRWPGLKKVLSRTANHHAEASRILNELALSDWNTLNQQENLQYKDRLSIEKLNTLTSERQRNLVRYWISDVNGYQLPGSTHLNRIFNEVIPAADDACPVVNWNEYEVRRYQMQLYLMKTESEHQSSDHYDWPDLSVPLEMNNLAQTLVAAEMKGKGISLSSIKGKNVSIRFRQGGETCRPSGRGNTQELKKLFQQWQVPPWQRDRIPLVYVDNELAQVVGYCISENYSASSEEQGYLIQATS